MVREPDSVSKIVEGLSIVSKKPFIYQKNWLYSPKELWISKQFFRDFTCPKLCGGCCKPFTLDYFPSKRLEILKRKHKRYFEKFKPRVIEVNSYKVLVYTYYHKKKSQFCDFLSEEGRCPIHEVNPLACALELIKFNRARDKGVITKKLFGRGWEMKTLSGTGALCQMKSFNYNTFINTDLLLLKEVNQVAKLFHLPTWLDETIKVFRGIKQVPKNNIQIH